jgi:hypothetical protein
MSEVHNQNEESQVEEKEQATDKDAFVPKEAYQRVSQDMHKYKNSMKDIQSQLELLKVEKEETEKQKLMEQEKWKELYSKAEEKMKLLAQERDSERTKFIDSHKRNAVIQQLGGFKRPEYSKFVDVSNLELADDGTIIEDSINSEVERIRKEFPELIKVSSKQPLPDAAPKKLEQKQLSEMSPEEINALRRQLLSGN